MNISQIKSSAKEQIKGKIGILFLIMLIISAISAVAAFVLSFIPMGSIVASIIITPAFTLSTVRVFLKVIKGIKPEVDDAFSGFNDFWSAFKLIFLMELFIFLWSLLFIIPGIIKAYSYSMAPYILAENKGKSARECINESKKMTEGYKLDLFVLGLSFIGWAILAWFTLGILYIWLVPYMETSRANAYRALNPIVEAPALEATPEIAQSEEQTDAK